MNAARLQLYGDGGTLVEDVRYSDYKDFGGVSYPSDIRLRRPAEDYELAITVEKVVFNQDIPPEKFELKKPANAELVELGEAESNDGK